MELFVLGKWGLSVMAIFNIYYIFDVALPLLCLIEDNAMQIFTNWMSEYLRHHNVPQIHAWLIGTYDFFLLRNWDIRLFLPPKILAFNDLMWENRVNLPSWCLVNRNGISDLMLHVFQNCIKVPRLMRFFHLSLTTTTNCQSMWQ